jgi:hypothetical protein
VLYCFAAPPAPENGKVQNVGSRWAELQWSVPEGSEELNACPAESMFVRCEHLTSEEQSNVTVLVSSSRVTANVTELRPFSTYLCTAQLNNAQSSERSDELRVVTGEEGKSRSN